jgi:hypothetical protein
MLEQLSLNYFENLPKMNSGLVGCCSRLDALEGNSTGLRSTPFGTSGLMFKGVIATVSTGTKSVHQVLQHLKVLFMLAFVVLKLG